MVLKHENRNLASLNMTDKVLFSQRETLPSRFALPGEIAPSPGPFNDYPAGRRYSFERPDSPNQFLLHIYLIEVSNASIPPSLTRDSSMTICFRPLLEKRIMSSGSTEKARLCRYPNASSDNITSADDLGESL